MKKTFTLLFVICSATICAAQNWIQLTVPTTADIKSSSFISDHEGWIGTDNNGQAYIYHTADSGTTWNAIAVTGGSGGTSYVCFVSSSVGYVVVNTMAFKTVDGGNTWDPLTIPGVPYYTPYFFNTDTGFINGDGEVYKTTDGGGTWSIHEAGAFARIHFLNDNIGCASENEGDIYITVDGGVTWIYYQTGELIDHIYSAWYKQNGQLVYCGHLGSGPFSIANLEGTSEKYVNEDFETLYDVRFFGNDYGYAPGAEGNVVYTSDGGYHWNETNLAELFLLPNFNLYRVDGINSVYVFGEGGRAFRKNAACSVIAGFDYLINGVTVQFTDTSINADSWLWDFGDGTTSMLQNPLHTYNSVGNYSVCLTSSYGSCGNDIGCHSIKTCEPNTSDSIAGTLDNSFNEDGMLTLDFANSVNDYGTSIAVQADGKVVAGGLNLARYNEDGTPDMTFGTGGIVVVPMEGRPVTKLLPSGKIILGGQYDDLPAVMQFNTDGTIDASFGTNGIAGVDMMGDNSVQDMLSMAIQQDEKILITGYRGYQTLNIARFNSDGTLDATFDGDGIRPLTEFYDMVNVNDGGDLAIQTDGKIVIVTQGATASGGLAVIRLNEDGSIDSTFSNDGYRNIHITTGSNADDVATCVMIQPDGKILVGGMAGTSLPAAWNFAMVRLNMNGSSDASFGASGIVSFQVGNTGSWCEDAVLQSDGRIIMAGYTYKTPGNLKQQCLARLTANGTIDTTFGTNGTVLTQLYCSPTAAYSVALFDDKIYTAGEIKVNNTLNADFFLARYFNGCTPVSADFSMVASGPDVTFTDNSQDATDWFWDFGDGTSDTLPSPFHTYASPGTYTACLIATNACSADTFCQAVNVIATASGAATNNEMDLKANPNPFTDHSLISFSLKKSAHVTLLLSDLHGRKIKTIAEGNFDAGNHQLQFEKVNLLPGIYLVQLEERSLIQIQKLVIQ